MDGIVSDVRFALRTFRRAPGFTVVVVGTIGAGIAACAVVFGIVNAVLWRPFETLGAPAGLVYIFEQNPKQGLTGLASPSNVADWQRLARSFDRIAAIAPRTMTVLGGPEPESVFGGAVSDAFFGILKARAVAGRTFLAADFASGGAPIVLLAHSYWRDRFAASPSVVGRSLTVDGRPLTVAGVLAPECSLKPFFGTEPLVFVPSPLAGGGDRAARSLFTVAVMKPGVKTREARAEMQAIAARLAAANRENAGWGTVLVNPREIDPQGDAQFLIVLAVGMLCVLLIVSANVTNLLLSRAAGRGREIATRLAIGAGRFRIARQLLVEALVLGAAGSAAGVVATFWLCRLLRWWLATTNIAHFDVQVDQRVLVFSAGISVFVALAAGLLPACRLSRVPIAGGLKEGAAGWSPLSPARLRRLLVASEVGLSVVLVVAAGLVLESSVHLRRVDPGFRAENVYSVTVTLPAARYGGLPARTAFVDEVLARCERRPEVRSASAATHIPAVGGEVPVEPFDVEGRPNSGERSPSAGVISVSPGYFKTMEIPIRAGRPFTADDRGGVAPVAIVSEGLARRWLGGGTPIGARVRLKDQWRTVVGVAGDVRTFHLNVAPAPTIYVPYSQRAAETVCFMLRAGGGDAAHLVAAARDEIHAVDAQQPVRGGRALQGVMMQSLGGFDLGTVVVAALAGVALALASIGIYGVLAYSVTRRAREFGIRVAVGAAPRDLVREVVGEGARVALYGGVPGLLAAAAAGRVLASRLQRVSPLDPLTFGCTAAIVVAVVLLASYVPARRALGLDPVVATRAE